MPTLHSKNCVRSRTISTKTWIIAGLLFPILVIAAVVSLDGWRKSNIEMAFATLSGWLVMMPFLYWKNKHLPVKRLMQKSFWLPLPHAGVLFCTTAIIFHNGGDLSLFIMLISIPFAYAIQLTFIGISWALIKYRLLNIVD